MEYSASSEVADESRVFSFAKTKHCSLRGIFRPNQSIPEPSRLARGRIHPHVGFILANFVFQQDISLSTAPGISKYSLILKNLCMRCELALNFCDE